MQKMSKDEYMRHMLIMSPKVEDVQAKLEKAPDDPELWYEMGMAKSVAGDEDAAVRAFSKGLYYAPFDAFLHFGRGRKLNSAGQFWPAIAELTLACRLDSTEWTFLYYRATSYNLHGMYEESCKDFRNCIPIAKESDGCALVHWLFTTYLLELNDPKRAGESLSLIPRDVVAPKMDYGYERNFRLYTGQVSKEDFIDIPDIEKNSLPLPGRVDLELVTMYYGLFAYCVFTGDEEGADKALLEALKIKIPNAFGYMKAKKFAIQRGLIKE